VLGSLALLATIVAAVPIMPQNTNFMGRRYDMGKTTLADAPLVGISMVAAVSSAHITAFYGVSIADESTLRQSVAVGLTVAGVCRTNLFIQMPSSVRPKH
jgi:hypothetical protein